MHRLSATAKAVDFYYIQEKKEQGDKHKIYLVQTTIGADHSANLTAAASYLVKMEEQMKKNRELCVKHANGEDATLDKRYPYLMDDDCKELDIADLWRTKDEVALYLLFVQNVLRKDFTTPKNTPKYESRGNMSQVTKLANAIETTYATWT